MSQVDLVLAVTLVTVVSLGLTLLIRTGCGRAILVLALIVVLFVGLFLFVGCSVANGPDSTTRSQFDENATIDLSDPFDADVICPLVRLKKAILREPFGPKTGTCAP